MEFYILQLMALRIDNTSTVPKQNTNHLFGKNLTKAKVMFYNFYLIIICKISEFYYFDFDTTRFLKF